MKSIENTRLYRDSSQLLFTRNASSLFRPPQLVVEHVHMLAGNYRGVSEFT